MLSDKELQELADFSTTDYVLSVFLNNIPSEKSSEANSLRLRNMLKNIDLPNDVAVIEKFFTQEYDRSGKGLVMYSCVPQKYFRAFSLAVPVPDMVYTGNRPSIRPLVRLFHSYGSYGVILVDKQGSRLFHFHMGELSEQEGMIGEAVKRTKLGGASSVPGRRGGSGGQTRAFDEQVERNMKETVEFAEHFFSNNHVRRILIGGTDDNVSQFKNLLPKSWQSLIMGTFPMSMTANHDEVLEKALQIGKESDNSREERLIEKLIENFAKDNNAIMGLEGTLEAINSARVQTLIVSEDFVSRGYTCPRCNQLFPFKKNISCSHCEDQPLAVEDIVDLAVSHVISQNGDVEVTRSNKKFAEGGNIGAFLRY